jgi:hypothetical protein
MAGANSEIRITDLDFDTIKQNLKTYLKSQNILNDYNYEGSALATLIDLLAYNTQYNAYYLNMVANEMFLDTAIQRASVISHAKLLGYTPQSFTAPTAKVNITFNNVQENSLTLPKFTNFLSEAIDGVNYNFVTVDDSTVNTSNNSASFTNVELKQGIPTRITYTVDKTQNPKLMFRIPEVTVDTSTISVIVQKSVADNSTETFTLATNYLTINDESAVFFLQESTDGRYEIQFGDGILGKTLDNGNIVYISYIVTRGISSRGANNFTLTQSVSGYGNPTITPLQKASFGSNRETLDSIKFQAPKSFAAQNRAVTKDDYITIIQTNKFNIPVQSVSVWGGEENDPPKYGKIFVAVKPVGEYLLTDYQKQILVEDVIKPVSVVTVSPEIVDVDYVYLILTADVLYDPSKTTLTSAQIKTLVRNGVVTFSNQNLNTFNSVFILSDLITYVKSLNSSILAVDFDLYLQKRIIPVFNNSLDYTVKFGNVLERSLGEKALRISPSFSQYDSNVTFYENVFFEESEDYPGTLQTYYYKDETKNILTISDDTINAGTIDYTNGIVVLKNFAPTSLNSNDGLVRINAYPSKRIVSSTFDRIITLDELDPYSITVNVTAK